MNIFQTLIAYEGNGVTGFVPEAATCVPGYSSGQPGNCVSLYGSDLVVNSAAGTPEYYTFVIGPSHFYDPATGASWQVYPSDVMFSVARSQALFQYLGVGSTGGWDIGQEMLQENTSNKAYDGGLHYPYNNTVQGIMENMYVNATGYCPTSVLDGAAGTFGCITFNVYGGNASWPIFEETLTQVFSGATILPCGWYTYEGAGLPGFAGSSQAKGDGPCLLPGGATSTNSTAYQTWLSQTSPEAWDAVDESMINYPAPDPSVQWNVVGSGPYYEVPGGLSPGVSYQLAANPDFVTSAFCSSTPLPGCQPAAGTYINHIYVYWEPSDEVGTEEYVAGQADLATISSTNTPTLLALTSQGKTQYISFPTLSIFFWAFDLNTSISGLKGILPAGSVVNVGSTFLDSIAVRQLIVNAWPYTTINDTIQTVDGVSFGYNYGGVIPLGMGNYTPTNVSWPSGNPTNSTYPAGNPNEVGSAAWWWAQGTDPSSPYYDAQLAACTTKNPCIFPFLGQTGDPGLDESITLWIAEVEAITDNALKPYDYDIEFGGPTGSVAYSTTSAPGTSPINLYTLGWIPDYPDPSNNVVAMVLANGTYTNGNALYGQLINNTAVSSTTCPYYGATTSFAALNYYATQTPNGQISQICQGVAYTIANYWGDFATTLPTATQAQLEYRELVYNLFEHILNELALYLYVDQAVIVESSAPWINESSLNTNVEVGGGGDNYFFQIQYAFPGYSTTFTESGLAAGTTWSVTVGGVTQSSSTSSIVFTEKNGTYPYTVSLVTGYTATPVNGTITVNGASPAPVSVTYTPTTGPNFVAPITFTGLVTGTPFSITVSPGGVYTTNSPLSSITLAVQAGANYTYSVVIPAGYTLNGLNSSSTFTGTFNNATGSKGLTFGFLSNAPAFTTYAAVFNEAGLANGATWSVSATGYLGLTYTNSTTYNATTGAGSTITVWERAGPGGLEYPYTVTASGYTVSPSSGYLYLTATVNGVVVNQYATFTKTSSSSSFSTSLSTLAWIIIGVLAVLVVISLAMAAMMSRRTRPPAGAPQSWDEPKSGSGGTSGGTPPPASPPSGSGGTP